MTRPRNRAEERALSSLRETLSRVRADRTRGARGLALTTLRAMSAAVQRFRRLPTAELPGTCRKVAEELRTTQPAMGAFQQWSIEWTEIARRTSPPRILAQVRRWVRTKSDAIRQEGPRIEAIARKRFRPGAHVVTLSRSDSVRRTLTSLPRRQRPRDVTVLESRPGGEGRDLAHDLRAAGLHVRLVPDRAGIRWVRTSDLLLLGADAVYSDGSVVHKTGTRRLALEAGRVGVPVVVVTGRSKGVERRRPLGPLPRWFDRTPGWAITEYWTDRGWVRGGRWPGRSSRR